MAMVVVVVPPVAVVSEVCVEVVMLPPYGVKLINLRIVSWFTEMPNPAK